MRESVLRLAIIFEGGLIVLALGLGWLIGSPPFAELFPRWRSVGLGLAATAVPLVVFWWLAESRWPPLRRLMVEVERIVEVFSGCSYGEIALVSALAGLGEEGFFRGVVQAGLAAWVHPWAAIIGASALFGLGHFITPAYAVVAGLFGVYLGALFFASGDLLPSIIAHSLYDFVALIYLLRKLRLRNAASAA
jgi:uncharacterized protein